MDIKIDAGMKSKFPSIRLGCIKYTAAVEETNAALWDVIEKNVIPSLTGIMAETPINDFKNVACSRAAYKAFGKDPNRYRVSSDALYRRVKQGKGLYKINTVVDTNNLVSLESGFSVGSYDTANISRNITFRTGLPGESYAGIGKENINIENLPVLCDESGPFGSPTSDSTRAMISLSSRDILTVIYDFSEDENLDSLLKSAAEYFKKYAKAENIEIFTVE